VCGGCGGQGLGDSEEFVIVKAIGAMTAIVDLELLHKPVLRELLTDTVPFLVHPVCSPSPPCDNKVMVIVWRLRGNIIRIVLYCQRATSSMSTVNKNSSYSPVGP